jgi:hypothetical protein
VEPNKPRYIDPAGDPRQGALPAEPPFVFRVGLKTLEHA